ncbi:MAG: DUF5685 family protein [Oscillospiraceae bacterium]|jgi:hypothetical protein|nr:DUF5685 family protein [Oscillospiraceae bacterium]
MFGYIRPLAPELRVRELEMFRALYCGVCHALGRRGGLAARCVLSYDFVFLAALLWPEGEGVRVAKRRCPASLRKKRCCVNVNAATEAAAAYGIILAYHKLRDDERDEGHLRAAAARTAVFCLGGAYRRAALEFSDFDGAARDRLEALAEAEASDDAPLDAVADRFAGLLECIARSGQDEATRRARGSLLYHIGRWLYLMDARDDLAEDDRKRRPNVLRARGGGDGELRLTAAHSLNLAISAFELLPESPWSDILRNILCLGLPEEQERVFSGGRKRRRGYRGI